MTEHLILSVISDIILAVSLVQITYASRSHKLDSIVKIRECFEKIRIDEQVVYSLDENLILAHDKFPSKPPKRTKDTKLSPYEQKKLELTSEQLSLMQELSNDDLQKIFRIINHLNDIGQLIETRIINADVVMSQYHTKIIRLVSCVECVRRRQDIHLKTTIGGNYGHRLLRMYYLAVNYNLMHSKHRKSKVFVRLSDGKSILLLNSASNKGIRMKLSRIHCRFKYELRKAFP